MSAPQYQEAAQTIEALRTLADELESELRRRAED